jgi:WD40 repeat protein
MAALNALPNELLSLVTAYLERPKDVANLALSSRRLYQFTKTDGWRAFLRGRFGVSGLDHDAHNAVHGLTSLYRNWDRKAFLAKYVEPTSTIDLSNWSKKLWRGPQGQTMGYQPSIDSYEEIVGRWTDRKEVLAWSAGTQVVMRIKETGAKAASVRKEKTEEAFDDYGNLASWYTYQIPRAREGIDDITALKLLRPHQDSGSSENVVFGSASGALSLLSVDPSRQVHDTRSYDTKLRAVGSLSISTDGPVIAATLGDSALALYPLDLESPPEEQVQALSEVTPKGFGVHIGRIWSCNFIAKDKVAVGLGPSNEPIQIYEITPSGFDPHPLRTFSLDSKSWSGIRNGPTSRLNTSVYPIIPVEDRCEAGNLFLSGGYDGIIRLHDMRSPHGFEILFWDVTNDSSIYSLAMQGLERVVAGTSMHSMVKVFDVRFSGSHVYHSARLSSTSSAKPKGRQQDYTANKIVSDAVHNTGATSVAGGWNLFLHPRRNNIRSRSRLARSEDSPIYNLSIPSSTSPSVYAGVEGAVLSLDFHSLLDTHADPLFTGTVESLEGTNTIDLSKSYNPDGNVLNLGMYEQGNEQALNMQLMVQEDIGIAVAKNAKERDPMRFKDLDERWRDPSGELWTRGQDPGTTRAGTGRGGRGGRGRGRGRRGW